MATRAEIIIDGDVGPLRKVLRDGLDGVRSFAYQTDSSMRSVGGAFDIIHSKFGLLMSALTGGAFGAFIGSTIDMMDTLDETSQKVGVSTEALSELAYAAKFASLDTDDLTKMLVKLSATLQDAKDGQKSAVEVFGRLRLDPKNIKDADELLMQLADRFAAMPEGVAKTSMAIDVFGEKLGPKLLPLLDGGRNGIAALRAEAHELGVVVSNEAGAEAAKFNDQLDRMKAAASGVGMTITMKVLPGLTQLAEMWAKNTKESGAFLGLMTTIGARLKLAIGMDDMSQQQSQLSRTSERMKSLATEMTRLQEIVDANPRAVIGGSFGDDGHASMLASDRIKVLRSEYDKTAVSAAKLRAQLLEMADAAEGKPNVGGGRGFTNPAKVEPKMFEPLPKPAPKETGSASGASEKSRMAALEAMLAKEKQVLIEAGFIREYEMENEKRFWDEKLKLANLSADDRQRIDRRVAQLSYEIKKNEVGRERELLSLEASDGEAMLLSRLEGERAASKVLLDNGQITKEQFLRMELQYEEDKYQIQKRALQKRLELAAMDPQTNPVERAKILAALKELDEKRVRDTLETMGKMQSNGGSEFDPFQGIKGRFDESLMGMLTSGRSFGQAMQHIFQPVRDAFIKHLIVEPLARYVSNLAVMLAAKMGFITAETTAQAAGSAATVGIKGAETTAVVAANAAEAGTGAAASQASIPFVGPMLALAAMAAVFAAVSAMGSKGRKSAAGGYDIPAGINPVTQLHEEEMVLPAKYANAFRDMVGGGGGQQPAGDTHHWSINAIDARSFEGFLRNGGADVMVKSLAERRRSGAF
jgi:hypothetical protein